jgi:hypothetical protein
MLAKQLLKQFAACELAGRLPSRVARFLLVRVTKTGKNAPN